MLGRHAAAVGKVEEDQDPLAQQKRWPRKGTFERLAMLNICNSNCTMNEWEPLDGLFN